MAGVMVQRPALGFPTSLVLRVADGMVESESFGSVHLLRAMGSGMGLWAGYVLVEARRPEGGRTDAVLRVRVDEVGDNPVRGIKRLAPLELVGLEVSGLGDPARSHPFFRCSAVREVSR